LIYNEDRINHRALVCSDFGGVFEIRTARPDLFRARSEGLPNEPKPAQVQNEASMLNDAACASGNPPAVSRGPARVRWMAATRLWSIDVMLFVVYYVKVHVNEDVNTDERTF